MKRNQTKPNCQSPTTIAARERRDRKGARVCDPQPLAAQSNGLRLTEPRSAKVSLCSFAACLLLLLSTASASATVRYADVNSASPTPPYTNWATAARVIQDAVDAAAPGDTVLVTNGVYATGGRPVGTNLLSNRVAIEKPIRLESVNGPAVTIIEGARAPAGDERGNGNGAVRCVYLGLTNAVLSGFTLTNGHTRTTGDYERDQAGGGAWGGTWNKMGGVLTNCAITGNSANSSGGGAYGCRLYNCTLTGNSAEHGGGSSGGTLNNCTLTGNSATNSGGGASYGFLYNCALTGNSADGSGGGAAGGVLNNCTLTGNSAQDGGGSSGGMLNNCSLTGNSALRGGGDYGSTLYNCTVTGNSALYGGGGASFSTLKNCIVYYNSATVGPNSDQSSTLDYCCTPPPPESWQGVGNITLDPQLASTSHLSAGSPCRGAGNLAYATGTDIDGEPWANPPSIGCDEYRAGVVTGPLSVAIVAAYTNVAAGQPVDFTALIEGRASASVWDFGGGVVLSNRPYATHAWTTLGNYPVVLQAYNESYPTGVSAIVTVHVVSQQVHFVATNSANPLPPYTSWATAARTIQDAVDAATQAGAMVLVSNGVYATGGRAVVRAETNRVALTKPLIVRSVNGPEVTTIVGETTLTNELGEVIGYEGGRCVYLGNSSILSGFTLTNGFSYEGAGVFCENSGVVTNCFVTGNSAFNGGGGGAYGGTLYHCTLIGNFAGVRGGYGGGAYGSILYNCTLISNSASGTLIGRGGGAYASTLYSCTLNGNSASDSGGGKGGSAGGGSADSILYNCTLTDNWASYYGGGVAFSTLYSCTLISNSASGTLVGRGGGAYGGTLNNCIVYFNSATNGANHFGEEWSPILLNYCCTTPLPTNGVGNITADPIFVDAANGDFRLRLGSPCIDTGTNLTGTISTDLTGLPRPMDGNYDGIARFDMGAYEFNPYRFEPTLSLTTDGFQFTIRGEPGRSVRIERSHDLANWEFAGQVPIPASGQTLIDPAATTETQLFYRAMRTP